MTLLVYEALSTRRFTVFSSNYMLYSCSAIPNNNYAYFYFYNYIKNTIKLKNNWGLIWNKKLRGIQLSSLVIHVVQISLSVT